MGRGPDNLLGVGAAQDGRPSATDCRQTAPCPVASSAWGAQEYSRSPGGRLWSMGASSIEGAFLEMERWVSQNSHRAARLRLSRESFVKRKHPSTMSFLSELFLSQTHLSLLNSVCFELKKAILKSLLSRLTLLCPSLRIFLQ